MAPLPPGVGHSLWHRFTGDFEDVQPRAVVRETVWLTGPIAQEGAANTIITTLPHIMTLTSCMNECRLVATPSPRSTLAGRARVPPTTSAQAW